MRDLRKQCLTYRDIAGHCGYSITTAFRYCNDVTTKRKQHMKPNTCDIEKMCHLRSKRYQIQQIAEIMGFSKATVSKYTSHLKKSSLHSRDFSHGRFTTHIYIISNTLWKINT